MKAIQVKRALQSAVNSVAQHPENYVMHPNTDFTRNRKFTFESTLRCIIGLNSKSLSTELLDFFRNTPQAATPSAFVQQRSKILPKAFEDIFSHFTNDLLAKSKADMPIFAVDGSSIQIPTNAEDDASYFPGKIGQKPYNLLHLNAMYDIQNHLYVDAIVQGRHEMNESRACVEMVDRSMIDKALLIADRGYEGYNLMAHCQEKGWYFLVRVKDGINGIKHGLSLPDEETFDVPITLYLTRKQTNETKELIKRHPSFKRISATTVFDYLPKTNKAKEPALFYPVHFRVVRFKLSEKCYETVVTNLDPRQYPSEVIKGLYAMRWGIESSFRALKYTLGLLQFHSKKVMCILQEIYAHLTLYNFVEMITAHVAIKKRQRQYTYKANFSTAVYICRLFYKGKTTSPKAEALIADSITPIRPGRSSPRNQSQLRSSYSFVYRIS